MTLREWMITNNVSQRDMARRLNTSQQNVLRWQREVTPSLEMIQLISKETGGQVNFEDFLLAAKYEGDKRLYEAGKVDYSVVLAWKHVPGDDE